MDDLKSFISETYKLNLDGYTEQKVSRDIYTYSHDGEDKVFYIISSPNKKELDSINLFIANLANTKLLSQQGVLTSSESEWFERNGKFYTLYLTNKFNSLLDFSMTKVRLNEILDKIEKINSVSGDIVEEIENNDKYSVFNISDKIIRQLQKALYFLSDKEKLKVSAYEYIKINSDVIELSKTHLVDVIEKINADINRDVINFNLDNSFYLDNSQVKVLIIDKIFRGDPLFLYAKLASLILEAESSNDSEDLIEIITNRYSSISQSLYAPDYLTTVADIYSLIKLYKILKDDPVIEEVNLKNIVARLYKVDFVEWV